jgi:hypothetical protein
VHRRRYLNIKIINNFKPPLGTPDILNITLEEDHPRNIWAKFGFYCKTGTVG